MRNQVLLIAALVTMGLAEPVYAQVASPHYFGFSGQLLNSSDQPLSSPQSVVFTIMDPSGTCILYEETQSSVQIDSLGNFSVQIGNGTQTANTPSGFSWTAMFQNQSPVPATGCGSTYTPAAGDYRSLKVTVGGTSLTPIPLSAVPVANVAETLQGLEPNSFLQVGTGALTQANVQSIFASSANYNALQNLINGTSSLYLSSATNGTVPVPSLTTNPSVPSSGEMWYNSTSHTINFYNGSSVQTVGTGGGTMTSITAGTGLSGGTITTSGTISMPNVGTAGTYTKVTTDAEGRVTAGTNITGADITSGTIGGTTSMTTSGNVAAANLSASTGLLLYGGSNVATIRAPTSLPASYTLTLPLANGTTGSVLTNDGTGNLSWSSSGSAPIGPAGGDLSGSYPNPTIGRLQGTPVSSTAPTLGQTFRYDGTQYSPAFLGVADLRSSMAGHAQFFPTNCLPSQVMTYSSVTDSMNCASINLSGNYFVNGGNTYGAPAILGTTDSNPLILQTNGLQAMTVTQYGNVGIGTTAPVAPLQVFGGMQFGIPGTSATNNFSVTDVDSTSKPVLIAQSGPSANMGKTIVKSYGGGVQLMNSGGLIALDATESGNVGIGTTTPTSLFEVTSASPAPAVSVLAPPLSSGNSGMVSIGSVPFDGASPGHFVGNANGTILALDVATGFSGNFVDYQYGGSSVFSVSSSGAVNANGSMNVSGPLTTGTLTAASSGTIGGITLSSGTIAQPSTALTITTTTSGTNIRVIPATSGKVQLGSTGGAFTAAGYCSGNVSLTTPGVAGNLASCTTGLMPSTSTAVVNCSPTSSLAGYLTCSATGSMISCVAGVTYTGTLNCMWMTP